MNERDNIREILVFLGFKSFDQLNIGKYKILKQDIISTYNILHNKNISEDHINNMFEMRYSLKKKYNSVNSVNNDSIISNSVNNDSKPLTFKKVIDFTKYTHGKFEHSEDDTINNLINNDNIIESYKEQKSLNKMIEVSTNVINETNDKNIIIPMIKLDNKITVDERDNIYEKMIDTLKPTLGGSILEKTLHYDFLRGLPQPVQKSKEWYELREGMITASAAAEILGESKYGTREEILLDKVGILPNKYKENMFVHHGKKYEKIATMIYEELFNTKVGEFGLVPYQNDSSDIMNINFIGASPDGISTCIKLDGTQNDKVGRMLEIKCPLKRKILTEGPIDGEICPHYYWVQVQLQLACCKNDDCDFWQCNLQEYSDDDWLLDNSEDVKIVCKSTVEQNIDLPINSKLTKGCIIQLLPKDKSNIPKGDRWNWYAKYIYPSNLMMSDNEYLDWTTFIEKEWKTVYPELVNDYYFDKVLYWKLQNCHNVLIKRDIEWFNSKVPAFKTFWEEVLELRNDKVKSQALLDKFLSKKRVYTKKDSVLSNDSVPLNSKSKLKKTDNPTNQTMFNNNLNLKEIFIKSNTKKKSLLDNDDDFLSDSK